MAPPPFATRSDSQKVYSIAKKRTLREGTSTKKPPGCDSMRLALRAFYFASLAHLATRNLITIAKFKSNRDYERELRRRGHSLPDLLSLFGENVSTFDSTWYGMHEINQEAVGQFLANVERIKAV